MELKVLNAYINVAKIVVFKSLRLKLKTSTTTNNLNHNKNNNTNKNFHNNKNNNEIPFGSCPPFWGGPGPS
jgi:hypothetical protein